MGLDVLLYVSIYHTNEKPCGLEYSSLSKPEKGLKFMGLYNFAKVDHIPV